MCGIAGIMDSAGRRPIDRSALQHMTDSIAHRGPDGHGFHLAPGIGLGQRRLAIIDVAGGQQPIYNEDGAIALVYNGEMYNYQSLMAELEAKGHRFRTRSDTEVVVHAWEEWGEACLERLRGMFAFALWDERQETLFLARDRFGKKPLYYACLDDGRVLFGSELKALLTCRELPRVINPTAIEDFFAYGYVPESKSIYRDVAKLPPAHFLSIRRGRPIPAPRAYWDIAFDDGSTIGESEAQEELVSRLREAVKVRLISEVPLGAFLSGGVDSSAVVAMMAETSDLVETFSIGFKQAAFDESEYASRIASQYKTRHWSRIVDADDFALVKRLARIYDEPFADASAIPTFRVSALAREKVTVALSGDGGDELLAGYRRYRWHQSEEKVRGLLREEIRAPLFRAIGQLYPKLDWAPRALRAKATLLELACGTVEGYFYNVSMLDDGVRRKLFSPRLHQELQGYHAKQELERYFAAAPAEHPLARAQYVDLKTYLPGDILTKIDRASMASSLETRAPFLDHQLAEWTATALPSRFKLHNGEGKYVLKKALESRLPHDVLYRPKQGFVVPLAAWIRGPLRDRVKSAIDGSLLTETGWFNQAYVESAFAEHVSGLRDHSRMIWALLMFDAFLRDVHQAPVKAADAVRLESVG
jgi:asparagine synthase (glutamine-hydrolysing)